MKYPKPWIATRNDLITAMNLRDLGRTRRDDKNDADARARERYEDPTLEMIQAEIRDPGTSRRSVKNDTSIGQGGGFVCLPSGHSCRSLPESGEAIKPNRQIVQCNAGVSPDRLMQPRWRHNKPS